MKLSDEQRAAKRARIKALWADPEFRRRHLEGVRAGVERNKITGEASRKKSAASKAVWADPEKRARVLAGVRKKMESGYAEVMAEKLCRQRADPAFEEKRRRRSAEAFERHRSKYVAIISAYNRRKRGFTVPAHLRKEYLYLLKVKCLPASEVGRILGLVP